MEIASIMPRLGALVVVLAGIATEASAEENLLDYLPSNPSLSSVNDKGEYLKRLLSSSPNEGQQQLLQELSSDSTEFGVSVTSTDGTQSGDEVTNVLKGESDQSIATFSIMLNPALSREDTIEAIARHGLLVQKAAEDFGLISGAQVISELSMDVSSPEYEAAARNALEALRSDSSFLSVAPAASFGGIQDVSSTLSTESTSLGYDYENALEYVAVGDAGPDWGLENIRADIAWRHPLSRQGKAVGVLDMGFSIHNDLPLWDLPGSVRAADHGNHVAGILCANHDQIGTSGVLPKCLVVARAPDFSTQTDLFGIDADTMVDVMIAFSEIVQNRNDIKAINISIGYNWWKKGDPTKLTDDQKRDIANLGVQAAGAYRLAKERGIFIVSAAGNDSWGLDPKFNAAWSSPINYASLAFCKGEGWCNGVIVEAHDNQDKHADFSNVGGTLSCPGVDILSTVAFDQNRQPSMNSYAKTRGTSQASPYCAGGLVLLSMLRPNYEVPELIECARSSGRKTGDFSAPALDIGAALEACP